MRFKSTKTHYVYVLFRPWNMVPCYVGKGKGRRIYEHFSLGRRHPNRYLRAILKKADGPLPFEIVLETEDETEAFAKEIEMIAFYGRADMKLGPLCNFTDGGEGQTNPSAETVEKIRTSLTGRKMTPEAIKNSADAHRGLKRSAETKARMSAAQMGNKNSSGCTRSAETRAKLRIPKLGNKYCVGKTHTAEARAKISAAHKGRKFSPEHIAKLVEARKGNVVSAETREKHRAKMIERMSSPELRKKISDATKAYWVRKRENAQL